MKKRLINAFLLAFAVGFVAWMTGVPTADARNTYYVDKGCQGCHGATSTCAGCHAHGTHSSNKKKDINITGVTNKTAYTAGETVSVTINGGYKSGWVRAILYNQSMAELARVKGSFPITLTAAAPTTAGTYRWSVSWYGNKYDAVGAYFQTACSSTVTTNCWKASTTNANHGEAIVQTNSFTVTGSGGGVENTAALCSDRIDNDNDGSIDCADSGCAAFCGSPEQCQDGVDNDGDGQIDCADSNCSTDASCTGAANSSHKGINAYNGPATCLACHADAGTEVLNSMHGSWLGPTPNVTNITGDSGKWRQTNNYCTDPQLADYACLKCHVSLVAPTDAQGKVDMSKTKLTANDMDCLQCHQSKYFATFTPTATSSHVSCVDGSTHVYQTPVKEADGKIHKAMRLDLAPGETALSLARTVRRPDNATCVTKCHAKAGGGDGVKRGDISSAMVNPTTAVDVHLSSAGTAKLTCTSCHASTDATGKSNHQIPGRGNDMRGEDTGSAIKKCVDCHASYATTGHGTSTTNRQAATRHVAHVDCTGCHIDYYGKGVATEISRDWTAPVWNPAGCEGQGAYIGHEVKGSNVVPEFRFWNKTSWVYDRNGTAGLMTDPIDGGLAMSFPNGGINDGKLYPFKVHTSKNPIDNTSGKTNFDVLKMFMTGCFDQAATSGLSYIGESGTYTWTNNKAFQLITHGVAPKTEGNNCTKCHVTNFDTGVISKLDKLGYKTTKPTSDLCNDCHSYQSSTSFTSVHNTHRGRVNCSSCHTNITGR